VVTDNERVGGQVRSLEVQTQRALTVIASQVEALAARSVRPTNAVPERVTGGGGGTRTEAPAGPGGVHAIKSGETLAVVAKKYGVSVEAIMKANPSVDSRRLKVGQKIKIPGGSSAPAAR
jgi:LysM repeat protein